MITPRLEHLLERLAPVVREEMLKVCVPNCCVATVAALCRVFHHFRFAATPMAVTVTIRNARMVEEIAKGTAIPDDPKALSAWMDKTGAWAIGICPESAAVSAYPCFAGHLVVRVQDVIVDASLNQADRPRHKIVLAPFIAVEIPPAFVHGKSALSGTVNGCEVSYARLRDHSWRSSEDWTNERRYRGTVNAIIRRVRDVDFQSHRSDSELGGMVQPA